MKTNLLMTFLLALALGSGTATAQPAPFNETGVTMGHWHLASKDVKANKKLFVAMGGKLYMPGGNPLMVSSQLGHTPIQDDATLGGNG